MARETAARTLKIALIVAVSRNGVIGKNGKMPWHLPSDMAHFKQTTTGHAVVMGRKTFESIGKPLPDRLNILLSRQKNYGRDDVHVVTSAEEAIKLAQQQGHKMLIVIGGGEIYKIFEPLASTIYLTEVDMIADGDTYFIFEASHWSEAHRQRLPTGESDSAECSLVTLKH